MNYKQIVKKLEKRKAAIEKERDKLCDLQTEVDSLLDSLELADDNLQSAIDALSQFIQEK